MGLKNRAVHMMLANSNLAPFELVNPPERRQDWVLIDHLMTIFKVKPDDYVEAEHKLSIVNMARTLASRYMPDIRKAKHVVLVKDGHGAQKPAVRDARDKYQPEPHIQFCKDNLLAIEYTMMKLLCDAISDDKFFLITGANTNYVERTTQGSGKVTHEDCAVATNDGIVVSFHNAYIEYLSREDDVSMLSEDYGLSDVDPNYADGKISRPEGVNGVFLVTFAEPGNRTLATLRDACLSCTSTEADTLMVELANILEGSVTISSGDSDVIAVFAACARPGVTLRMDNLSYTNGRKMHTSPFGELLFASRRNRTAPPSLQELTSAENRFRVLCDTEEGDDSIILDVRGLHDRWESVFIAQRCDAGVSLETLARYLYLGGIRGSVYTEFLGRLFTLSESETLEVVTGIEGILRADTRARQAGDVFGYIFGDLSPCYRGRSTKRSRDDADSECAQQELEHVPVAQDFEHLIEHSVESNTSKVNTLTKKDVVALKRLSKLYADALVPKGSHGRFLQLLQTKWHFHMRIRQDVFCSDLVRDAYVIFMILCGTDYNQSLPQMGSKRLMACASDERFPSWCQQLIQLWYSESQDDKLYHDAALTLANMSAVPAGIVSKLWTPNRCSMIMKNMKYVYELWHLKHPTPGSEYGLVVIEGIVRHDVK